MNNLEGTGFGKIIVTMNSKISLLKKELRCSSTSTKLFIKISKILTLEKACFLEKKDKMNN